MTSASPSTLRRALGFGSLTFYGIGMIIGAGIYSVIGAAAGQAGAGLWLSFVLAAVAAFLTGLSYAELSTTFPEAGAEYVYAHHAFPRRDWPAFILGFVLTVAAAATATTVSLAFGGYLQVFAPVPVWLSAALLLILGTALNIGGIREASWVNIVLTCVEIVGLLLVIAAALGHGNFGEGVWVRPTSGVLSGAAVIFFVYLGFEEIANLAEETREPEKTLPRSIFLSLIVTTALYVLVAIAVMAISSPRQLAASSSPLADAVGGVWPRFAGVLAVIALVSTANTALITLIAGSRLIFAMGRSGDMPKSLGRIWDRRATPWVSAITILLVAMALLPLGGVEAAAELSSFASLVAFAAVNVALIVLRLRDPKRKRPFRVPMAVRNVPIPAVAGIMVALVLALQFDRAVYVAGAITILLAFTAFALHARTAR